MNRNSLIAVLLCFVLAIQMGTVALAAEYDGGGISFDDFTETIKEFGNEGLNAYDESALPEDFFISEERASGTMVEREPNNTMATATVTFSDYDNRGRIQTQGDVDYWKITLSKGHANFWIEAPTNGQYYQYEVLDANGNFAGSTSTANKLVKRTLPAGTYYIKVYTTSNYYNANMQYLFRCKLYPYTATIMQGNTERESDCLAAYNKLTDGGYKNIAIYGWQYLDANHSKILDARVTEAEFLAAKNYDIAYYSGHGGRKSNEPVINFRPSNSANNFGTSSEIYVATALGVSGNSWRSTAVWQPNDTIRVLILAACQQLTETNVQSYARIMRASGIRAIVGYYGTGPGHETDTNIANSFFDQAAEETSVYEAWKSANNIYGSPWAVLVYNENSNQFYRLPGYPGYTYTTPSSTAQVYLYSKQKPNGSATLSNPTISEIQDDLPLEFSLRSEARLAIVADESREPVYTDETLPDMTDDAISELSEIAGGIDAYGFPIRGDGVVRKEVDDEGYVIADSEIVVERGYTMHDMYRGVKVADSFISISYDSAGVNSVVNRWKDIYSEYAVELIAGDDMQPTELMGETEAMAIAEEAARSYHEEEAFEVYSTDLAYAPAGDGIYELAYEVSTSCGVYYVSVQTGNIL